MLSVLLRPNWELCQMIQRMETALCKGRITENQGQMSRRQASGKPGGAWLPAEQGRWKSPGVETCAWNTGGPDIRPQGSEGTEPRGCPQG
jgi:hypothetical protein